MTLNIDNEVALLLKLGYHIEPTDGSPDTLTITDKDRKTIGTINTDQDIHKVRMQIIGVLAQTKGDEYQYVDVAFLSQQRTKMLPHLLESLGPVESDITGRLAPLIFNVMDEGFRIYNERFKMLAENPDAMGEFMSIFVRLHMKTMVEFYLYPAIAIGHTPNVGMFQELVSNIVGSIQDEFKAIGVDIPVTIQGSD